MGFPKDLLSILQRAEPRVIYKNTHMAHCEVISLVAHPLKLPTLEVGSVLRSIRSFVRLLMLKGLFLMFKRLSDLNTGSFCV